VGREGKCVKSRGSIPGRQTEPAQDCAPERIRELEARVAELEAANERLHAGATLSRRMREDLRKALRDAEEGRRTLEALMESVPEGITIADAQGVTVRMVSRFGQELLGAPYHNLTVRDVMRRWTVYCKDGKHRLTPEEAPLCRAVQQGETVRDAELVQVSSDGRRLHLSCNAAPIRDGKGHIIGGVVTWRDVSAQKQAEAALRESERRFRVLFETMTEGFAVHEIICDDHGTPVDFRFLDINPAFERLTGLGRDIVGKTHSQVLPDEDPQWVQTYGRVALTGEAIHFQNHSPVLNRHYRVVAFSPAPGQFATLLEDITERIQAEEALRRSEERVRSVVENSHDIIYRINDRTGRFEYISSAVETIQGFTPAEMLAMDAEAVSSLIHPDDVPRLRAACERLAVTGRESVEYRVRTKSGGSCWFSNHLTVVRDAQGKPLYRDGSVRDITDRKRAEELRRQHEARLGLLSRTAGQLLISKDPHSAVEDVCQDVMRSLDCDVFINFLVDDGAGRLHLNACGGLDPEVVRTLEWLDYGEDICGQMAQIHQREVVERLLDSADPRHARVKALGLQAYCCHPLMAEGRLMGTLAFGTRKRVRFTEDEEEVIRTIADQLATAMDRVLKKRALSEANAHLIEADCRKNEFIAMLSHELRNPLAPIKNSIFVLDRVPPDSEQARRAWAVIGRQVNHLARLVDDLLDVTRMTRNKIVLQREDVDLNDLVKRVAEDQRSLFDDKGLHLLIELAPDALVVNGDSARLAQVISNLFQNAAKFTPRDGQISVRVESDAKCAAIRVRDTGVGMKPETVRRLFEPFMQADATLDRSQGGLGLGLALVKGLVELHQGQVCAHSDGIGCGAEFVVRLPARTASSVDPLNAPTALQDRGT
jgi:PAS domain S-box-containing protein